MSERLELTLVVLAVLICGIIWGVGYVGPKNDTRRAASECMSAQGLSLDNSAESKAAWEVCIDKAEKQHGSKLLTVMGY